MNWQNYMQQVIYPEAEQELEKINQEGCPVCGSHDFGWIEMEGWLRGVQYYGCINCIKIKEIFTTV